MTSLKLAIVTLLLQLACQPYQSQHQLERTGTPSSSLPAAPNSSDQEVKVKPIKLYPVDEAPDDPSFAQFRGRLLEAVSKHDSNFVLGILDPEIINSSDGERGENGFRHLWKLDEPESRLWQTLTTLLSMGGSFRENGGNREFCAPYVTSKWSTVVSQLPKGADPLDYQVIIDKNVPVRSEPVPTAPVVATLTYDVVKLSANGSVTHSENGNSWLKISTPAGKQGFVPDDYVRSPTDYQACFKKTGSRWLMIELAARE